MNPNFSEEIPYVHRRAPGQRGCCRRDRSRTATPAGGIGHGRGSGGEAETGGSGYRPTCRSLPAGRRIGGPGASGGERAGRGRRSGGGTDVDGGGGPGAASDVASGRAVRRCSSGRCRGCTRSRRTRSRCPPRSRGRASESIHAPKVEDPGDRGGVGKSSVTVNLGVALSRLGYDVGILDADVYGFSVPKMLGVTEDPLIIGDLVVPATANGVRCLSMGFFVPDDTPVIWRGPMLHKALEQFLVDAYWGEPDYLLVDMPPGTGDVTLSLGQYLTKTEVFVVTTPQPAAQRVAQRSAYAARKLKLSVRGVIENMSWFTGDDGTRYELFGAGGGKELADELGVPLLAQVPLVPALREGADVGIPVVVADPDGEAAAIFAALALSIVEMGPARVYRKELTVR